MAKYEIEPFDWQYKLNQLSIELKKKVAYVEVTGENFDDELENCEMLLMKISYDNYSDIMENMFDQLNHLIASPLSICFHQYQDTLESIEIFDNNDNKNTIVFIEPFLVTNYE
jgi:c-di-AMP phosphodiesterase-like protein